MNEAYCRYCYARDKQGMKDAEVAKKSGIGKSTFSDWKSGRSMPKEEKMRKIATAVGSTYDYISTGKDEPVAIDDLIAGKDEDLEKLIDMYHYLNDKQKDKLIDYAEYLHTKEPDKNQ